MINKHKKFLTAAVFCAIASTGFVLTASAEETMTHDLDEVVVEADKDALPGTISLFAASKATVPVPT